MTVLVSRTPITVTPVAPFRIAGSAVDRQLSLVTLRLRRPTTPDPVAWPAARRLRIRIGVVLDGKVRTLAETSVRGGLAVRAGVEYPWYALTLTPEWGYFGARTGFPKRLGETGTDYTAWLQIDAPDGRVDTVLEVAVEAAPAPAIPFTSSVAFDATASAQEGPNSDGALSVSLTTSGSDRGLVAGSALEDALGSGATVSTVTYAGTTVGAEASADVGSEIADLRSLINPASGANTLAVTLTGVIWGLAIGGVSFTGANQTDMLSTPATATGTSTTPTVNVTGTGTDEVVVDIVSAGDDITTVGAGQTTRWDEFSSGVLAGRQSTEPGSGGTITMSHTIASSTTWATVAARVLAAAAGDTLFAQGVC